MIALHKAMSPVTYSGTSGSTRVATASLIQLLPLVCKVIASLLATVPEMSDKPTPVRSAGLLMMTYSMRYWIQVTSRDVAMLVWIRSLDRELVQGIIYGGFDSL
jgi:hypothetical protein